MSPDQTVFKQQFPSDSVAVQTARNCQLDLLRATAILMVVAYHTIQMSPKPLPGLMRFAVFGQHGVDLFFVLSGWLIGNLYWKEQGSFGNVELVRFWARRWLRTIPPYLVALSLSWGAVLVERREPFDWGYLMFLQNYYHRLPFFLVSWSLCVEEHFYLLVPAFLIAIGPRKLSIAIGFVSLILMALVCRNLLAGPTDPEFGFTLTATHLRTEGLLLGFWAAYVFNSDSIRWALLKTTSKWVGLAAFLIVILLVPLSHEWMYRVGLTLVGFGFVCLLVWRLERPPGAISSSASVRWSALGSYSIYLTHALMLHVSRKLVSAFPALPWFSYFFVAILLIAVAGGMFYVAIERPSIALRDRWVPRRVRAQKAHGVSLTQCSS